jgi:hypothetical protein
MVLSYNIIKYEDEYQKEEQPLQYRASNTHSYSAHLESQGGKVKIKLSFLLIN